MSAGIPVKTSLAATVAAIYRAAVVAADVLAVPGTVTCTKQATGSCDAGEHTVYVSAGNAYGRTTPTVGNTTVTTETTNLTVRAAFAAVTGATYYDIYCSTDGAAAKWVGRITEAQRASGIKITAVGTTGVGGVAGAVDIGEVGTGIAANAASNAVNTAFSVPASPVNCSGHQYVDFDVSMTRSGDAVVPAVTVIPFYYNARTDTYSAGTVTALTFGGAAGVFNPLTQRVRVEARGNAGMALVVASIAGTGASIDVDATLS
ncbi:MAG: hypothetical protein Q7T25_14130 [Sideroxyarcus sp.]|nr:hypothetical protein [Sideroxyarcus sp.]